MKKGTRELARVVGPEVVRQATRSGMMVLSDEQLDDCNEEQARLIVRLMAWGTVASFEIAAQRRGARDYQRESVQEWHSLRDYTPLRSALGADLVLFVLVRDLQEITGQALANFFGRRYTFFKKVGVACVAELSGGRMVACTSQVDFAGDLANPAIATWLVQRLFYDLGQLLDSIPPARPPEPEDQ